MAPGLYFLPGGMYFLPGGMDFLSGDVHFFDEGGVGVGEDVALVAPQGAAGDVEVDSQVGVVALHRHTDVLRRYSGDTGLIPGRTSGATPVRPSVPQR